MRPSDNYQYEKPSQYRQSYQDTAAKSPDRNRVDQTQEYTPTRFGKKPSERVSQLKNSINKCIESFSNKKQMNRDALQQVKEVNREIIQSMSGQAPNRAYRSSQRRFEQNQQPQYRTDYAPRDQKQRDNVTLSSFHLIPNAEYPGRHSHFQTSQVYRPQSLSSNQYQAQELRHRIRNERMQNEQLLRQVQSLRREQQQHLVSTSNFGQQDNPYLAQQNLRLRQQLETINSRHNIQAVYEEFQKLKEDNQRLRRETIGLLKNGRY